MACAPKQFGNWHTIHTRMNRCSKSEILDPAFAQLRQAQIIRVKIEAMALDSTLGKVYSDGTLALKNGPQAGCRGCSNELNLCFVPGPDPRCPQGTYVAATLQEKVAPGSPVNGSGI